MQMFGNKSARSPTRFPQRSVILTNLLQLSLFLGPPQFTSLSKNFLFSINNLCMKLTWSRLRALVAEAWVLFVSTEGLLFNSIYKTAAKFL